MCFQPYLVNNFLGLTYNDKLKDLFLQKHFYFMIKIGVLGAGYLGKIHIKLLMNIEGFELVGIYDPDKSKVQEAIKEYGVKAYSSSKDLLSEVDAIDIVTPTTTHFNCAVDAIKSSKHVFIEKPISYSVDEALELVNLNNEAGLIIQVGHVERFNPALVAAKTKINNPMFIESHRLAQYNSRGTDVSVVTDLMIHDIDVVLSLVNSPLKRVSASGVAVVSDTPDIANARLEFNNGCVANLTASRISTNNMRKTRIFQPDAYIMLDFLNKNTEIYRVNGHNKDDLKNGKISIEKPEIVNSNAIEEELKSFLNSVINSKRAVVTIEDGYNAILLAQQILDSMRNTSNSF